MKKYKSILLAIGMSAVMAGCASGSGTGQDVNSKASQDTSATETNEKNEEEAVTSDEPAETDDSSKSQESDKAGENAQDEEPHEDGDQDLATSAEDEESEDKEADDKKDTKGSSSVEAYEKLISGDNTLSFDYYWKNVFKEAEYLSYVDETIDRLPVVEGFTLTELVEAFDKIFKTEEYYYAEGEISSVEYAYLDCGDDGEKELAIKMRGPFVEPESEMTFVVKNIEDKLQVVYAFCSWSRSYTELNEYGLISGDGSNGASNHGWDMDYIDADGKYQYGYYREMEYDFNSFAYSKEHEEYDLSKLEGNIITYSLWLHEYSSEEPNADYCTYEVTTKDTYETIAVPDLYTDSEYKDIVDGFKDCNFVSMTEFAKIEDDKLKSIGVTDTIAAGKALEFTEISIEKESKDDDKASEAVPSDGSIQSELAGVEAKYQEYENMDWGMMAQQDMNITTYKMYTLWDDELNSLWSRLTEEITPEEKEELVAEQRAWIKEKEAAVKEAGNEALGGTLQPQLENGTACVYTRKRTYELAAKLAKVKGESFEIPAGVNDLD